MIIQLILYAIAIILYVFLIKYIIMLEKTGCACSQDWRREFIKYYFIFLIVMLIVKFALADSTLMKFISPFSFIILLAAVVIIYQYVNDLKIKKCKCSAGQMRNILEIFNYIQIILLAIVLLFVIYMMVVSSNSKLSVKLSKK